MIKISSLLEEIIQGDDVAREALRLNILNMSAYAKSVQPVISRRLYRQVSTASIVVSLSRLRKRFTDAPDYRPRVRIEDLTLRTNLSEVTFEKSKDSVIAAAKLNTLLIDPDAFFAITQGNHELTIICDTTHLTHITSQFISPPKGTYSDLTAITVRFIEQEYIEIPNMIFTLISALAIQRINLIEIVSTYSELSFIVRSTDAQRTIAALSEFLTPGKGART